ncbi:GTP-binding protein HflX [Acetoanaerobium pronyense]|uniref:GTPase HflX n=1 Tax=Acetoanaerobium pronyense TaxID=1482736 RepID=A0ABS4KIJ3_9FIRM|nr:GTPase HflX [Acetoanaerobium pronyense]MBP2027611.1 GTP-binding protein HflX [Acetoanaerobium pronyense]
MENKLDINKPKMILMGLNVTTYSKRSNKFNLEESMEELEELAKAAGGDVVGVMIQNRETYDVAYYVGKGKAEEIRDYKDKLGADMIVFNEELSGAQIRNLEELISSKVIDRTTLILDIFAQRAISKEGRLQVELAQLKYRIPRLIGFGAEMSRTGAGIGTRGPGEKKLETDKRHIRRRIVEIKKELDEIKSNRAVQRSKRLKSSLPIVALVGYTNAGKSTILNELIKTHKEYEEDKKVFVKDMLFATLDTSLRKASLPSNKEYLVTDTVGFVSDLPHDLVDAFKSTLEEVVYADILLHVVDSSNEHFKLQIETTKQVLSEIGAENKKTIYVFNKADKVNFEIPFIPQGEEYIFISAKSGYNMDVLLEEIEKSLKSNLVKVELKIPFDKGDIVSSLHKKYKFTEEYDENGFIISLEIDEEDFGRYKEYLND